MIPRRKARRAINLASGGGRVSVTPYPDDPFRSHRSSSPTMAFPSHGMPVACAAPLLVFLFFFHYCEANTSVSVHLACSCLLMGRSALPLSLCLISRQLPPSHVSIALPLPLSHHFSSSSLPPLNVSYLSCLRFSSFTSGPLSHTTFWSQTCTTLRRCVHKPLFLSLCLCPPLSYL